MLYFSISGLLRSLGGLGEFYLSKSPNGLIGDIYGVFSRNLLLFLWSDGGNVSKGMSFSN
jgi:hypothetical protein